MTRHTTRTGKGQIHRQRPANMQSQRRQLLASGITLTGALAVPALLSRPASAAESISGRLQQLGISLPEVPPPVANYVPFLLQDQFVYIAGQIPFLDGVLIHPGSVPNEVSIENGRAAARQCGINILAALSGALNGNLDRVRQCMRLDGFVASAAGFTQQPAIVNGASDLMVDVFGAAGRHTRTAVGVSELPLNACVEVAAVFIVD